MKTHAASQPSPSVPGAQITATSFIAEDGRELPLRQWLSVDESGQPVSPKAVIVALHGFNDHNTAFELPAEVWRHLGIATYAYDQRGFGANPDHGLWPGSKALTQDLASAIQALRLLYPHVPVYALGESMGGAIVLDAVGGNSGTTNAHPDGTILIAPAVWARRTMPLYQRAALWAAIRIIPAMKFTGADFAVQPSDNIPMLRALGRDPLFIKATRVDAIWGLANLMDEAFDALPHDAIDTLLLYGARDELVPKQAMSAAIGQIAGTESRTLRLAYYPNGWHMLLRDLDYEAVSIDVAHWIFDHTAALPSGADGEADAFFYKKDQTAAGRTLPDMPPRE